jgi:2-keto-4-pentenoate hydratase
VNASQEADQLSRAEAARAAAARLQQATRDGQPCGPVRDLIGRTDIALAYQVQQVLTAGRLAAGARIVGRKIGITSAAVMRQVNVDQPDFGVLFDDMLCPESEPIGMHRLLQPRAEAEIAFVLGADLDAEALAAGRLEASIDHLLPAIEIVDSRVSNWDITITDTVADNASSGLFVLGAQATRLADVSPVTVTMELAKDDAVVSTGSGADCLGDPMNAVAWLARTCCEYGAPLRAGDVILSGALGPMVPVESGTHLVATLSQLGSVSASFR